MSLWVSGLPTSEHYGSLLKPTECFQPAASPCPNFGTPASVGPSVAGPFLWYWDRLISWHFRPSSAPPMTETPDYRPPSGPAYYFPSVHSNGVSVAYFGGNSHLGQWSFDPRRPERLTHPLGPLLVSRTLYQFLVFIFHLVRFNVTARQPGPR